MATQQPRQGLVVPPDLLLGLLRCAHDCTRHHHTISSFISAAKSQAPRGMSVRSGSTRSFRDTLPTVARGGRRERRGRGAAGAGGHRGAPAARVVLHRGRRRVRSLPRGPWGPPSCPCSTTTVSQLLGLLVGRARWSRLLLLLCFYVCDALVALVFQVSGLFCVVCLYVCWDHAPI